MTAKLIDGRKISQKVRGEVASEVSRLKALGVTPGLATVLVGDDMASQTYVQLKHKACGELGLYSEDHKLSSAISEDELIALVKKLDKNKKIHGILVQLPLPSHISKDRVLESIDPEKDVDGFHPINIGRLVAGDETLAPATPKGVVYLLEQVTNLEGKNVVVINRSTLVGKPLALMLIQRSATVTVCHSKTVDLKSRAREADVLVTAVGKPGFVTSDFVRDGAIVVDVGTAQTSSGIRGDVDFDGVRMKASYVTPVPGGVGPMTIAMLMVNTINAAKEQCNLK